MHLIRIYPFLLNKQRSMAHRSIWPTPVYLSWASYYIHKINNTESFRNVWRENYISNTIIYLDAAEFAALTHCGLVTLYGVGDLGHEWIRRWKFSWRAINWTNVHSRVIFTWTFEMSVAKLCLKITYLISKPHPPGNSELTDYDLCTFIIYIYNIYIWSFICT